MARFVCLTVFCSFRLFFSPFYLCMSCSGAGDFSLGDIHCSIHSSIVHNSRLFANISWLVLVYYANFLPPHLKSAQKWSDTELFKRIRFHTRCIQYANYITANNQSDCLIWCFTMWHNDTLYPTVNLVPHWLFSLFVHLLLPPSRRLCFFLSMYCIFSPSLLLFYYGPCLGLIHLPCYALVEWRHTFDLRYC